MAQNNIYTNFTHSLFQDFTAIIVFSDGTYFTGFGFGAEGEAVGEACFNTSMTGYQEILTDPSYAGQIINFTFPHIGIVGVNGEDYESRGIFASGLIVREAITNPSNFRAENHLCDWLKENGKVGISGVDTRAITRAIRTKGAMNAAIMHKSSGIGEIAPLVDSLKQKAAAHRTLNNLDLASEVTTEKSYKWNTGTWQLGVGYSAMTAPKYKVVAVDFGEKLNILRLLAQYGADVQVVSARTSAEEIIKMNPDGVFLSNGPADPAATGEYAVPMIRRLIDAGLPIFGICLGFQLLALAVGAKTRKMKQGHRGANHPVKNLESGLVEITSQNHGFEVIAETLPANAKVTHISLFDGTLEGFKLTDKPVFAVQYHPEASPGPRDSEYLFGQFAESIKLHMNQNLEKKSA